MTEAIADRAEVFQSREDQQWYVRTISSNGEVIMTSEGYWHRDHAFMVADDTGLPVEEVEVL